MDDLHNNGAPTLRLRSEELVVDFPCAICLPGDGKWYRAALAAVKGDIVEAVLLDFGRVAAASVSKHVRRLTPQFTSPLPAQAVAAQLGGVALPGAGPRTGWPWCGSTTRLPSACRTESSWAGACWRRAWPAPPPSSCWPSRPGPGPRSGTGWRSCCRSRRSCSGWPGCGLSRRSRGRSWPGSGRWRGRAGGSWGGLVSPGAGSRGDRVVGEGAEMGRVKVEEGEENKGEEMNGFVGKAAEVVMEKVDIMGEGFKKAEVVMDEEVESRATKVVRGKEERVKAKDAVAATRAEEARPGGRAGPVGRLHDLLASVLGGGAVGGAGGGGGGRPGGEGRGADGRTAILLQSRSR